MKLNWVYDVKKKHLPRKSTKNDQCINIFGLQHDVKCINLNSNWFIVAGGGGKNLVLIVFYFLFIANWKKSRMRCAVRRLMLKLVGITSNYLLNLLWLF